MTAENDDPLDRGLRDVLAAAEQLVAARELSPLAIPEPLARLVGTLGDTPVTLTTRRYTGGGYSALTVAAIVEAAGPVRAVTVIGLPAPGSLAAIVGVDLVALGRALSLVAVDLAPTDLEWWTSQAAPRLEQLHAATADAVVARRWPQFAVEVFSPRALLAGARRGREGDVLTSVAAFVGSLASMDPGSDLAARARAEAAEERCRQWCLAERRNRREHDALARMFGEDATAAYIDLLFGLSHKPGDSRSTTSEEGPSAAARSQALSGSSKTPRSGAPS